MKIRQTSRTPGVLEEIGARIERLRLQRNQTQGELAAASGVGIATVQRLETGANTNLATLIQVLRALGRLGDLDVLVADVEVSPFEISGVRGTPRRRASGSGRSEGEGEGDDDG